jgi:hypothetical protein
MRKKIAKNTQPVPCRALIPRPLRESNVRLEYSTWFGPPTLLEITLGVSRFSTGLVGARPIAIQGRLYMCGLRINLDMYTKLWWGKILK